MTNDENFFDKTGAEIKMTEVEVGKIYPLYGMITNIISDDVDNVIVEINFNIEARITILDLEKLELIKERTFEPGIFIATITGKDKKIQADVSTVVFGKRQNPQVN